MKIRQGFVSNSSSSSFVVCKALIGNDKFERIKQLLIETEKEYGSGSDSGCSFNYNDNYISASVAYHMDFWDQFDLEPNEYLSGD